MQEPKMQVAILEQTKGTVRMGRKAKPSSGRRTQQGIKNRTVFIADNLEIMRGMEDGSVDLIYLDPPFNSKHDYSAPIGSKAAGAEFKDTWTLSDIDQAWWGEIAESNEPLYSIIGAAGKIGGKSTMSYLIYMSIRILEMHRILKDTGSLYLHCDPTMSHYLKLALDAVFGSNSFKNEIVWRRTENHNSAKRYGPIHDVILFFSKGKQYTWNRVVVREYTNDEIKSGFPHEDSRGRWTVGDLTGSGLRNGDSGNTWSGCNPSDIGKGRHWAAPHRRSIPEWAEVPPNWDRLTVLEKLDALNDQKLIHFTRNGTPQYKRYHKAGSGVVAQDFIFDIAPLPDSEDLGYPTQKPLALLERIIETSSYTGDIVFDPFCGCATACLAAERKGRKWIGCDISERAYSLIEQRLKKDAGIAKFITGAGEVTCRTDIPQRKGRRSKGIKHVLYGIQHGYCNGCLYHYQFKDLEVDHVIPKAKGGQDDDKNLQLLCGNCNRRKGKNLTMAELRATLKTDGMKFGSGRSDM